MKDRSLLMIPGPIEFEPAVLGAMGAPTTSHVAPDFIETFGRAIEGLREVWHAPTGQPFILAGSGTLAMDTAGANLVEPGDRVLVLSTGVFGDRFVDLLGRYGTQVDVLRTVPGETVDFDAVRDQLASADYKLMTATHVDTSTAVRVNAQTFGALGAEFGVLTILDGVCSVAGEEIRQDEWQLDVVLTASQKAIGVPPGLALVVAGPRAIQAFENRTTPVQNYYADWAKWLPIMRAYEDRRPSYFGTPAVNLVCALACSLELILAEGMETRWARHAVIGEAMRAAIHALDLGQIPTSDDHAANTLSAPRIPTGLEPPRLLSGIREAGVILAGGLYPELRSAYFRVGHMGAVRTGDLLATIGAIESSLASCGYPVSVGDGLRAAQHVLAA